MLHTKSIKFCLASGSSSHFGRTCERLKAKKSVLSVSMWAHVFNDRFVEFECSQFLVTFGI